MLEYYAARSFSSYLEKNGVYIDKNLSFDNIDLKNLKEENIMGQLEAISDFHKAASGYSGYLCEGMKNDTGKIIEKYKVEVNKFRRQLESYDRNPQKTYFQKLVLDKGSNYLKRAEECIVEVYKWGYFDLIQRSMLRIEICAGDTYFNDIKKEVNGVKISCIDKCCYNMDEIDAFYFLNKIKKKLNRAELKNYIDFFCKLEGMDLNSQKFIGALLSYPEDFIKCCSRYRDKKKSWSEEKFAVKLEKIIISDSSSLICRE
jgi:hypothetical protein